MNPESNQDNKIPALEPGVILGRKAIYVNLLSVICLFACALACHVLEGHLDSTTPRGVAIRSIGLSSFLILLTWSLVLSFFALRKKCWEPWPKLVIFLSIIEFCFIAPLLERMF